MRKSTIVIVTLVAFLIIGGLIGGLVGGLLLKSKHSTTSQRLLIRRQDKHNILISASSTSSNTASPLTSGGASTRTASSLSSAPTTATGPGGVHVECPAADNKNYTVRGTNEVFLRECLTDRQGSDIANVEQLSMEDCLAYCVSWNANPSNSQRCGAVTWVYNGPQGTDVNYCWIKYAVPGSSYAVNMESAVLVS
jgi:hypothetical protein